MPLIYAGVARGSAMLAEYSLFAGNFQAVAKDYLSRAAHTGRFAHTVDGHVFSFLAEEGYCYVVVSDEAAGRTIPSAFLDRVKGEFFAKYAEKGSAVKELGLSSFGKRLKEMMEHATQFPEEYSKVSSVQKRVDEVKAVMSDNIEKVLSRGEKLDLLADRFVKSGRALRRKMWWNNLKMKVVMAVAVIMVCLIIFLLICFGGGRSCIKRRHAAAGAPAASPQPPVVAGGNRRLLLQLLDSL
ncbi:VAMP726 [Scenedesmus sp. PABB004]|nr:VAMP726 [Scenedesmus sp. PABB004]